MSLRYAACATILVALAASAVSADSRIECALDGACCFPTKSFRYRAPPHHSALVDMPTVAGGLGKLIVRRYVRRESDALAACAVTGDGMIDLVILETGTARLVRTDFDAKTTSCMAHVIARLTFPAGSLTRAQVRLRVTTE